MAVMAVGAGSVRQYRMVSVRSVPYTAPVVVILRRVTDTGRHSGDTTDIHGQRVHVRAVSVPDYQIDSSSHTDSSETATGPSAHSSSPVERSESV